MKKLLFILGCILLTIHSFSQSDIAGAIFGHQRIAGRYVGWSPVPPGSVAGSFDLRNDFSGQPITFFTGGSAPLNQRMIINGSTGPTAGFVGIGLPTPLYQLDVQDRINITNNNALGFGYFINGFDVLQVPGTENTFVGKGAGASANMTAPFPFVQQNTFVGFQAGGSNVNGDRNTFVGRAAGYSMVNGRWNTFVGADAGLNLATGNANTFIGEHSG